jgi:steroid delta-isomerase-like uncharacterized protein
MGSDALALAREGVDVYNQADWGRYQQLLSSDSVYHEFATGRRIQGVDGIVEANKAWRAAFPDSKGTITSSLSSGDTAVIEILWEGTHRGPLQTPTGDSIAATGRAVKVPAVQIVKVSGERITENRHYFDSMTLMAQLGVTPAGTTA